MNWRKRHFRYSTARCQMTTKLQLPPVFITLVFSDSVTKSLFISTIFWRVLLARPYQELITGVETVPTCHLPPFPALGPQHPFHVTLSAVWDFACHGLQRDDSNDYTLVRAYVCLRPSSAIELSLTEASEPCLEVCHCYPVLRRNQGSDRWNLPKVIHHQ